MKVGNFVEQSEEDLVQALPSTAKSDDGVAVDEHGAALDLGARQHFHVDQLHPDLGVPGGQIGR